jgi:kynureninase
MDPQQLFAHPNALAKHYSRFRVQERLLLTGHSHQAWPDVGFEAQQQAWLDAAEFVDDKWSRAFEKAEAVQEGFRRLLGEPDADIALGPNTHELVLRFLSALDWRTRSQIITTDGEFHSIRRLVERLGEEPGVDVIRIPVDDPATLADRLAQRVSDRTLAVLCSSVMFQSARIVPELPVVAQACLHHGSAFLIDAYHQLNVVPFHPIGLEHAFVVGGGYKYCQLGEGVCFLRIPRDCTFRPITTGWFTEFDCLSSSRSNKVRYGEGSARFAGATYDPVSNYRAAAVFGFFREQHLTPEFLRAVSQHQIKLLAEEFDRLDLDPRMIRRDEKISLDQIAGFLVLHSEDAESIYRQLHQRGVLADFRGHALRLGPAPYLCDRQLVQAMGLLGDVCRSRASMG